MTHSTTRRTFLASLAAGSVSLKSVAAAAVPASELRDNAAFRKQLRNEVGMTVSSFSGHMTARPTAGKFTLLELPRLMRDELGMRVIDLSVIPQLTTGNTNAPAMMIGGRAADFVLMDQAQHAPGKNILESVELGNLPGVGMTVIDGAVRSLRSRNTPPAMRLPEVVKGSVVI